MFPARVSSLVGTGHDMCMSDNRKSLVLSPREQQLIQFASEGLTDTAIAYRLGISEATVGTYWGRVRIKMGPLNRTELVSVYLKQEQERALDALREENAQLLSEIKKVAEQTEQPSLYEQLIENAADAIVLVSESGEVISANRAAHELLLYSEGALVGRSVSDLIPDRLRDVHREHRADYIRDPQRRSMGKHLATPALRADGSEVMIRASLSSTTGPSGLVITCILRPLEEAPAPIETPGE